MLNVTNLSGFGVRPILPQEISYEALGQDASNQSTYTFSSLSFGTEDPERYIVAAVVGKQFVNQPTVTIGGVAATHLVTSDAEATDNYRVSIWIAKLSTGTSGDVVVSDFGSTGTHSGVTIYRVTGLRSASAIDSDSFAGTDASLNLTLEAGISGVIVAAVITTGGTYTFTGVTEDVDQSLEGSSQGSGHAAEATGGTKTVTIDNAGGRGAFAAVYLS